MPFQTLFRGLVQAALLGFALSLGSAGAASAAQLTTLYSFCAETGCKDGRSPSSVVTDAVGDLFGAATAASGRRHHPYHNEPFELIRTKKYKALHVQLGVDAQRSDLPWGFSVIDTAGNLYGIASGEAGQLGAIVEIARDKGDRKWSLHVLHAFCPQGGKCPDGADPEALSYQGAAAGLLYDGKSPLYGVAGNGGQYNEGVVFELVPNRGTWSEIVLYNFCSQTNCTDGHFPERLVIGADGTLFGVASNGYGGLLFQLTNTGSAWSEIVLHEFCGEPNCTDGASPTGITVDTSGNLYGTAGEGGLPCKISTLQSGCGLIYKLVPDGTSSKYTILYNFCAQDDCADGAAPRGVTFSSGYLYGVTGGGGGNIGHYGAQGSGVVFRFGSELDVLHSFCSETNCADGDAPNEPLVIDPSGTVFGSTWFGGVYSDGTVFRIDP